ncbi:MAG: pyruvate, phosphate dikinase, partial [Planctomycetes bacterium]|nr:pyruvate, phosphate dikinase [Planctomycetota bacterium]
RSDLIDRFLELNHLTGYQSLKYKTTDEIRHEYPLVKGVFRNSDFPVEIVQQMRAMLREIGTHPLIVRSSSLLEDRIGSAFSGKYASVFVANQGTLEVRLQALLVAISEVFASTMAPDPIAYRRERNLLDYHEDMGVLIQKVVGQQVGPYFAPAFAGVAFSRNEYRWSPRIKREDGLLRLVMGLGTRAVDRVGREHPRMVALGAPTLRPTTSDQVVAQTSQRTIDVINLEMNCLESIDIEELLALDDNVPRLDQIVSVFEDGSLSIPTGTRISASSSQLCVTFDKLLGRTTFAEAMHRILVRLEEAYGFPVDVEFAHDGEKLYLLQCRALASQRDVESVQIPSDLPQEHIVFSADKYVRTGLLSDIEYVVYVDPAAYDEIETHDRRIEVARVVGKINRALAKNRFVLVGPGRWGSNDIRLGVKVGYADINETCMLIEVARSKAGYTPEVSFGTHFFQDLVEADIGYLPLYPDDPKIIFNDAFFDGSENALASMLPQAEAFSEIVRVIHVPTVSAGMKLHIAMNGEQDEALAFLR